eukprot:m.240201 g.240201  ORF g.240201 m.240201 type:complete len:619 (+) comp18986_c1_seq11:169-2025(+)
MALKMGVMLLVAATLEAHCCAQRFGARLASGAVLANANNAAGLAAFNLTSATVFYSFAVTDNLVAGTDATAAYAKAHGYDSYGSGATLISATTPAGSLPAGALALKTFHSASLKDTLTTASAAGLAWASNASNGYVYLRVEGYCQPSSAAPSGSYASRLLTYWSAQRKDSFIVASGSAHEQSALDAGYQLAWDECVVVPEWAVWPDNAVQKQLPLPKSTDLLDWEYLPGANANYGHADTWYPSWASDGNLYTPWTDGTVNGVRSGSGGKPSEGYNSTTGIATVVGDNPFHLNVTDVHVFTSSSFPYQSRYPCGTLVYNDVWFYGTYNLNNPNSTTPQGDPLGPNPSPNCGNWCVQGPLVDFRHSKDFGQTWTEPRLNCSGPTDNLFGEASIHNQKVKFGAPHFVDFGQNMQHKLPDGKAYIVGHGASRPGAIQAWMLGDEIYMARCEPTPSAISDRAQWEFYAGGHGSGAQWVKGNVEAAKPLFVWNNHTGVVTMSYHEAINKFILVISTASFYPSMVKQFDTYFLEADSITGPWKYVTYMSEFGPEAYFAHFPTKFLATEANTTSGYYDTFLSYSANFAFHSGANPPLSGYHWSLQQSRFKLGAEFAAKLHKQNRRN